METGVPVAPALLQRPLSREFLLRVAQFCGWKESLNLRKTCRKAARLCKLYKNSMARDLVQMLSVTLASDGNVNLMVDARPPDLVIPLAKLLDCSYFLAVADFLFLQRSIGNEQSEVSAQFLDNFAASVDISAAQNIFVDNLDLPLLTFTRFLEKLTDLKRLDIRYCTIPSLQLQCLVQAFHDTPVSLTVMNPLEVTKNSLSEAAALTSVARPIGMLCLIGMNDTQFYDARDLNKFLQTAVFEKSATITLQQVRGQREQLTAAAIVHVSSINSMAILTICNESVVRVHIGRFVTVPWAELD